MPRAGTPSFDRATIWRRATPRAAPGEAEALDLLMKIVGGGSTSRLYKKLVVEDKVASNAGGYYCGLGPRLSARSASTRSPADGVSLDKVEAALDAVLAEVATKGVTEPELERAKKIYLADYVYESDNQSTLARRYGWALSVGRTIDDVEAWPDRIAKVTLDDVQKARGDLSRHPPLGDRPAAAGAPTSQPATGPSAARRGRQGDRCRADASSTP